MSLNAGRLLQNAAGQLIQNADGTLSQAKVDASVTGDAATGSGSCACCCFCDSAGTKGYHSTQILTITGFNRAGLEGALLSGPVVDFTFNSLPINDTFCLKLVGQANNNCLWRASVPGASASWVAGSIPAGSTTKLYIDFYTGWPTGMGGLTPNGTGQLFAYFPEMQAAGGGIGFGVLLSFIGITGIGCGLTSNTTTLVNAQAFVPASGGLSYIYTNGSYTVTDATC